MKGVILCGGTGSRLMPLTLVSNKHLLPVYDRPMIYHAIDLFVRSGIREILLVCGGNAAGEFLRILGNGEAFGLRRLHYTYQSEPRGIADALGLAEEFVDGEPVAVLLGDNVFEHDVAEAITEFESNPTGAMIFVTLVSNPKQYGVVEFSQYGSKVVSIEEKPENPKSNLIATGLYIYDQSVWNFIDELETSARGELEITDVNRFYLTRGLLRAKRISGEWMDCGESIEGYHRAQIKVARIMEGRK